MKEDFNGFASSAIALRKGSSSRSVSECNDGDGSRSVPKPGDSGGEGGMVDKESVCVLVVAALRFRRAVRSISESKRRSLSRDRRVCMN